MMYRQSVDMMLMPHSAPTPMQNPLCSREYVEFYDNMVGECAQRSARLLGVPAIMVNKCGPWQTLLPGPFTAQDSSFPGLSAIADSDGTVKAQLGDKEGIIVEDVTLDPSRKTHTPPQCRGRWAIKVPWQTKVFRAVEAFGALSYSFSSERKKRAREIASASGSMTEK
jgi:N-carbamoylputrescine amidase